jgi:hypothetical protein
MKVFIGILVLGSKFFVSGGFLTVSTRPGRGDQTLAFASIGPLAQTRQRLARLQALANDPLSLLIARSVSFIPEEVSLVCNQKKTSLKKT